MPKAKDKGSTTKARKAAKAPKPPKAAKGKPKGKPKPAAPASAPPTEGPPPGAPRLRRGWRALLRRRPVEDASKDASAERAEVTPSVRRHKPHADEPAAPAGAPIAAASDVVTAVPRRERGVLLRWRRTNSPSGTARYAEALAGALRGRGVDVRESHPFYAELRLGRLRLGGRLSLAVGARLPRWSRRRVVHATQPYDNPPFRSADVVTVHDVMPIVRPDLYALGRAGVRKRRRQVRRALRKAWVVVPSEHTRQELLATFPGDADAARIAVIPHGLDAAAFHPGEPATRWARALVRPGALNVLCVMNAERRKRIDLVAEAAAASPFVNLIHVGTDVAPPAHREPLEAAQKALRHMAKQGRYHRLGKLPDGALRDLMATVDVVVHASEAEGFGLPPLEAVACGACVLASDIPAHREVLGDAVRYFALTERALFDEFDLAWTGVTPTLEHFPPPDVRARQAALFTWDRCAERHQAVYGHIEK